MTHDATTSPSESAGELLKVLGVAFGVAVLVGNSIGMGILRTPGEVAQRLPAVGPFLGIWVLGAGYALLGALTISELSAARPRCGGLFPLIHDGLGPFPGFVAGWTDGLSTAGTVAAVAIVLGEYAGPLFGSGGDGASAIAAGVILGLAGMQWQGIRIGDLTQQVTSLLKTVALLALAAAALIVGGASGGTVAGPTTPATPGFPTGTALAGAVVVALQSAIYTYDGWTGPVYFGEEIRNPGRDIPRSLISGVLLVLIIYLALNIAFVRTLSVEEMAGDPFVAATAAARLFGPSGDTLLRVLMIVSLFAAVNANLLMGSRITYAMSCDAFLPPAVHRVSRGGTPRIALTLMTGIALVFVFTNTFDTVLAFLAFCFVFNYTLAFTAFFVLRHRAPDRPRPFRVPGYPWVPGLALLGSLAFLLGAIVNDTRNSLIAVGLLAVSWPVYSVLRRRTPAARTS